MTLLVSSPTHHFCFPPPEAEGGVRGRCGDWRVGVARAFIGNPL